MSQGDREGESVVTVVIPSFNEEVHIRDCLRSLLNQQTEVACDVIVVDSSTDATAEIIRAEFPTVHLLRREQRTSPAQARNLGMCQARAPIVAFIDADCTADPTWLDRLIQAHRGPHLAVGGSISLAAPHTLAGALLFAIEFSEFLPRSTPGEIRWLPSCNLSVKRRALEQYGGFPDDMEASEDILFSRRLTIESGMPLWFDPQIRIAHTNLDTLTEFRQKLQKLGYWSGRSRRSGLLPGGFLLRHPILIPLLIPYRFLCILIRLWRGLDHKKLFLLCLLCWPLLLYGLISWASSFKKGVREMENHDGSKVSDPNQAEP